MVSVTRCAHFDMLLTPVKISGVGNKNNKIMGVPKCVN